MIAKGCIEEGSALRRGLLLSLLLAALLLAASAQELGPRIALNVYLDSSGKVLVTGYAENESGLAFLNGSQYRFDVQSHQLYALTAGLTTKAGELWTLRFDASGVFEDYRVTFYLPRETSLGSINASEGLGYLLSASNESIVADVQGWEVSDPHISIQYRQLLEGVKSSLPEPPQDHPGEGAALIVLVIAAGLIAAGFAIAVLMQRRRRGEEKIDRAGRDEGKIDDGGRDEAKRGPSETIPPFVAPSNDLDALSQADARAAPDAIEVSEDEGVFPQVADAGPAATTATPSGPERRESETPPQKKTAVLLPPDPVPVARQEMPETRAPLGDGPVASAASAAQKPASERKEIAISSEMEAVMQTLTARERAVMSTLISHGGRMTQAEIRYETGTPKSSLTGILISLERRKLVIKKEWGRTNIIELSEWFLSKREPS